MSSFVLVLCLFFHTGPKDVAEQTMLFKEDLRLGPEQDFLFSGLNVFVSVDELGHMYVTVPGDQRILVIDAQGRKLKEMGGRGEGPGEFKMLTRFQITDRGAVAFDPFALQFFDKDLKFERELGLFGFSHMTHEMHFSRDGRLAFALQNREDREHGEMRVRTAIVSDTLEERLVLSQNAASTAGFKRDPSQMSRKELVTVMSQMIGMCTNGGMAAFLPDGRFLTARSGSYAIDVYGADLKKQGTLSQAVKPEKRSEQELEELAAVMMDMLPLPPGMQGMFNKKMLLEAITEAGLDVRPQLFGLIPTFDGGFLAVVDQRTDGSAKAHIYDKSHRRVGRMSRPNWGLLGRFSLVGTNQPVMTFRDGFAYTVELVDDDFHLVRYQVKTIPN